MYTCQIVSLYSSRAISFKQMQRKFGFWCKSPLISCWEVVHDHDQIHLLRIPSVVAQCEVPHLDEVRSKDYIHFRSSSIILQQSYRKHSFSKHTMFAQNHTKAWPVRINLLVSQRRKIQPQKKANSNMLAAAAVKGSQPAISHSHFHWNIFCCCSCPYFCLYFSVYFW